jgi:hypothetical protein
MVGFFGFDLYPYIADITLAANLHFYAAALRSKLPTETWHLSFRLDFRTAPFYPMHQNL